MWGGSFLLEHARVDDPSSRGWPHALEHAGSTSQTWGRDSSHMKLGGESVGGGWLELGGEE